MKKKSTKTFEYCPHCETEVVLNNEFVIQECPNCHKPIMPCSICTHGYVPELDNRCHSCTTCPLEAPKPKTFDVYVERRYFIGDIIKGVVALDKSEAESKALDAFPIYTDFLTKDKLMSLGGGFVDSYAEAREEKHFD